MGNTQIVVRPRQAGKTSAAVQWVREGVSTNSYPFWSRVLLVPSIHEAGRIRKDYPELDYRQVFSFAEWRNARLGRMPVEVAVDNVEALIAQTIGQRASFLTLNGEVTS